MLLGRPPAGLRGAFAWAAPEVLTGEQRVSEKADVYSLGVVLWVSRQLANWP